MEAQEKKQVARVYENPELCDRYTLLFTDGYGLALNEKPEGEQGFARWILVDEYDADKLGREIEFEALPGNVKSYVLNYLDNEV